MTSSPHGGRFDVWQALTPCNPPHRIGLHRAQGLTLTCRPGLMTALMGGSGAGRYQVCTPLLLHGRQTLVVLREAARTWSHCASRLSAGKTTLMDVIAGRKTQGIIEGDILVNGAMSCRTCATRLFRALSAPIKACDDAH